MKGKTILAMVVAVGLGGGVARAQPPSEHRKGAGPGDRGDRMTEYLGLSPEQQASFKTLRAEQHKQTKPLHAEGRQLHEALRTLMEQESPDATAVGTAMLALKQHQAKMKALHAAFEAKLKAMLTPRAEAEVRRFQGGP